MKNRREGDCAVCGARVAAMQGTLEGPPWKIKCGLCSGTLDTARIEATKEGNTCVLTIKGFLGDRFGDYRKATAGAGYDPKRRVNTATFEKVPQMLNALKAAGFVVDVHPALAATLQVFTVNLQEGIEAATTRADKVDARLRALGLYLFLFQKSGVAWLASKMAALLADEMGLGKTIQALIAIPVNAPCIVVCPAIAKGVWEREVRKWRPDIRVTVLSGRGSFRWPEPGEMIVLNYDILPTTKDGMEPPRPLFPDPLPVATQKGSGRTTPTKARAGETLRLSAPRTGKYTIVVEGFNKKNGEGHPIQVWDEKTCDQSFVVPETYRIKDPSFDGAILDAPEIELPVRYIAINWYTTHAHQSFGITRDDNGGYVEPQAPVDFSSMPPSCVLIADECHAIKSTKAQRTEKFRDFSVKVREACGRVWLLTATPLLNKPPELWSILQAASLGRDAFGSWDNFVSTFRGSLGQYGYTWGKPNADEVSACLRKVSLRRMRKEVLPDLPTKTYDTLMVDIDAKSKKLLDTLDTQVGAALGTDWKSLLEGGLTVGKMEALRARVSGMTEIGFEQMSRARAALAAAKTPALLELVEQFEEQEEPLVVFSAHRGPIELLGKREGWAMIAGGVSPEERTRIENDFQAGKLKGIASTIKAGGVAITLTRSSFAVFVDREFNPALNEQAEDRICRIGQTRGCVITTLKADHPLDCRLDALLTIKRGIIGASVDASSVTEAPPDILPDVDFDTLAAEAADEAARADEAKRIAGERVREIENARHKVREDILAGRVPGEGLPEALKVPERRLPRNGREVWAASALITLAGLDPDRAAERNDVGFNASDGQIGHILAGHVDFGLTDKQWTLAIALCTKYWRQVGRPPNLV